MKKTAFELTSEWFNYCFENPKEIVPSDTALYLWLIEKCNRCSWINEFSITSTECMAACGFATYPPYKKSFDNLVRIGFITIIKEAKNQWVTNIIAISKINKAPLKQATKHVKSISESTQESTFDINKTNKQETNKDIDNFKSLIIEKYPKVSKMKIQMTDENIKTLQEKYNHLLIIEKLDSMENQPKLLTKYESVYLTLNNWCKKDDSKYLPPNSPSELTPQQKADKAADDIANLFNLNSK